jgi:hypothetical protein
LRNSNAADGTARARNAHRRAHRLSVANALEDGVSAESVGQLPDTLDCGVPSLADDVRRPEPASEGNAIGVAAEHDDLLGTETTGGDDPAETHGTITHDGGNVARSHIRP